ncbi:MAG: hypothetical protein A3A24_01250 [Candidatus Buchananbacteria bacterium RIFCSPLOWO2_01_FULL_46_12]|uniref:Amidohydrolase-related domain-containing protein n=1 Tax=Candidatus Buchananbacteria bacterium RIFCSPLOWO2_01_FULL_46_12 TaxID=1797546 RepID=A0A1G1YRF3_9BACT|nr:MAG: hypothetical protein A3A24_01250 [Candidatus Buchananbacteria bacterium RIFCSPLOWO2_01_FULL_46_12]
MVKTKKIISDLRPVIAERISFEAQGHTRYKIIGQPKALKRVLIEGATFIVTVDNQEKLQVLPNRSIYIVNGIIKKVFPTKKLKIPRSQIDLLYDASLRGGIVVTPGFINGHAHPPMYMLRSSMTLDKGNIVDQVKKMAKLEAKMTEEDFFLGAVGDFTEEQKFGITTVLSHYATFEPIEKAARLTRQNVINAVSAVSNSHPENSPAMVEKILKKKSQYFSQPAIAIHYLHKATRQELEQVRRLVKKYKVILTMHAAENEQFVEDNVKQFGRRTVEALVDLGLANASTILSHAVHFSDEEIELVKKHKIGIVHLPTSNKLHKSGELRYPIFVKFKAEKQICLGTDSVISKNSLDLLSEALQSRITHIDKHRVLYEDLFKMMTSQAAQVLQLGQVGKILPGYRADLAFWKLKDRGFLPYNEKKPISLIGNMITHGGRNIRDLMINGEFIISNRRHNLVDESEILVNLQAAHMKLRRRLEK